MKLSLLKPITICLMLAITPLSISTAQAAVKVGSYVGNWKASATYVAGDLITYSNKTFISLVAKNKAKNPNSNPKVWQVLGGVGADGVGIIGPQGVVGNVGSQGSIGLTGATGPQGSQGLIGLTGATGPQGPAAGPRGFTGLTGIQGVAGAGASIHVIGDQYQGGIVFWVQADGQHGLIAAMTDQIASISWNNGLNKVTNTGGDGIGSGSMNTAMIVQIQTNDTVQTGNGTTGVFAALVAANYSVQDDGVSACSGSVSETCWGDWYLPSKFELNLLYQQRFIVGGFTAYLYWSSTEFIQSKVPQNNTAWAQDFSNGTQWVTGTQGSEPVRSIRAF